MQLALWLADIAPQRSDLYGTWYSVKLFDGIFRLLVLCERRDRCHYRSEPVGIDNFCNTCMANLCGIPIYQMQSFNENEYYSCTLWRMDVFGWHDGQHCLQQQNCQTRCKLHNWMDFGGQISGWWFWSSVQWWLQQHDPGYEKIKQIKIKVCLFVLSWEIDVPYFVVYWQKYRYHDNE